MKAFGQNLPEQIKSGLNSAYTWGMTAPENRNPIDTTMPSPPPPPPAYNMLAQGNPYQSVGGRSLPSPESIDVPTAPPPDQVNMKPFLPGGKNIGTISYTGPRLNTEAALSGLKGANSTANMTGRGDLGPSTEELYRHAFGDPESMAPGAGEMAGEQLRGRISAESWNRLQSQKQLETIMAGLTSQHPYVKAKGEQEADWASYPAQQAAQGLERQAQIGANARLQEADLDAQTADAVSLNKLREISASIGIEGMKSLLSAIMDPRNIENLGGLEGQQQALENAKTIINEMLMSVVGQ